jgi:glycosyltransferase involved in cell wall biosynthesis
MEVLVIAPFFPYPLQSGGQVRLYHFLRLLAKRHRVVLLSLIGEGDQRWVEQLRDICAEIEAVPVEMSSNGRSPLGARLLRCVPRILKMFQGVPFDVARFYSTDVASRFRRMIEHREFDVIHQEYMFMGSYLQGYRRRIGLAKTVLGEIDLSFVPLQREYQVQSGLSRLAGYLRYTTMKRYAIKRWRGFDTIVTASATDRDRVLSHLPWKKVSVIPNGVDVDYFRPTQNPHVDKRMVFVGSLRYAPNCDAVRFFCQEILPLIRADHPEATLTVIGADAPEGLAEGLPADGSVTLAGYLEDIRPTVSRAAVFVVPLRVGGGTRLKILEAMAMGVPVVSTPVGCEGIDALPDRDLMVAEHPNEFAAAIGALLNDEERRRAVARNGLKLVRQTYSWEAIGRELNDVYERLARVR